MDAPTSARRAGARIVDAVVLVWVVGIVIVEIQRRMFGGDPLGAEVMRPISGVEALVAVLGGMVLLEVIPLAIWGRTIGKVALGVRVVPVDDPAAVGIGPVAGFIRTAAFAAPLLVPIGGVPLAVAVIATALVFPGNRGILDRLAGTRVVAEPPGRPGRRHRFPRRAIEPLPLPAAAKAVLVDIGMPSEVPGFFEVDRRMAVYDEMLFTVGEDPSGMAICVVSPGGEVVAIDPEAVRPNRLVARDLAQLIDLFDAVIDVPLAQRAARLRDVDPDTLDDPDSWWRDRLDLTA